MICFLGALAPFVAIAQSVSISSDGSDPNANAMLDVQNPSSGDGKGLLIPKITESQRTTADSSLDGGLLGDDGNLRGGVAAQGLLVYQTDGTEGFYYNTSTSTTPSWVYLITNNTSSAVTFSSVDIEGGTIDGTAIGSSSTSTGSFTSVTASEDNAFYLGTTKALHRGNGNLTGNLIIGDGGGNLSHSSDSEGYYNTFAGSGAGLSCTTGDSNNAVGYQALTANTTGVANTAVGHQALCSNTTASENTGIGFCALYSNTTGAMNTAMGNSALTNNTTGNYNTGIGKDALTANTTGDANTAVGIHALGAGTTGESNVGMGFFSLSNTTTGSYNAAYGYASGNINVTGNKNTFIGYEADASSSSDLTNATALGYQAKVDASNKVVIGNSSVTAIGGYADWSNYSDRREKKEITDCTIGLEFVEKLRPVNFKYKNQDKLRNGFIAQEVEEACEETGAEFGGLTKPVNENGRYMLSYGDFVVPLVNAAKELKAKNEDLETEVKELKAELEAVKKKLGM